MCRIRRGGQARASACAKGHSPDSREISEKGQTPSRHLEETLPDTRAANKSSAFPAPSGALTSNGHINMEVERPTLILFCSEKVPSFILPTFQMKLINKVTVGIYLVNWEMGSGNQSSVIGQHLQRDSTEPGQDTKYCTGRSHAWFPVSVQI